MMFGLYIFHAYLFKYHFAQHFQLLPCIFAYNFDRHLRKPYIYFNSQKNMNIYTRSHNLRTQRIGWTAGRSPRRADLRVLIERLVL